MLNKSNKNNISPMTINNYNKFLISMDRKGNILEKNKYQSILTSNEINEINEMVTNDTVKEVRYELDKLLNHIEKTFECNDLKSSQFTGQTYNDIIMSAIEINDPNQYKDFSNKIYLPIKKWDISNKNNTNLKPESKIINIEAEINNIDDILKLLETYKYDATVKYNINMKSLHNIKEPLTELNDMIGMKDLKNNIVDQILYFVQDLHINKNLSGEFMHTVIYGTPGTGKTEIAKLMGKIYSKLGILSKGTFKKVTRSDLIAGYLGQTALKTRDVIKEAIGGVLFIDEAYSLGNAEKKDSFSKECIDTLCEALSDNKDNLMVIIAGYENELKECFFNYNQGLESRFIWRFKTDNYSGEDLYNIFLKKVNDIGWTIHENTNITVDWFKKNIEYFKFFGRDIENLLSKTKISHSKRVFSKSEIEKKKITLLDLENGLEIYLKNDEIKNRKEKEYFKKQLYSSIYS